MRSRVSAECHHELCSKSTVRLRRLTPRVLWWSPMCKSTAYIQQQGTPPMDPNFIAIAACLSSTDFAECEARTPATCLPASFQCPQDETKTTDATLPHTLQVLSRVVHLGNFAAGRQVLSCNAVLLNLYCNHLGMQPTKNTALSASLDKKRARLGIQLYVA